MIRPRLLRLAFSTALALAAAAPARGQTWTGPGTDWNTATNWDSGTVPNSATAAVNFAGTAVGTVNISSSVQTQSLTFSNPTGSYNLTSTGNTTLSGVSAITVAAAVTGTDSINLNYQNGFLVIASGGLTITNNSTQQYTTSLAITGNTYIGSVGSGGVTVTGPGFTQINSFFLTPVVGGLAKTGPGSLAFGGDGSSLSGGLSLNGGTLTLDYSVNPAPKQSTSPANGLALAGGVLNLVTSSATVPVLETIGGSTLIAAGQTYIVGSGSGGTLVLALAGITRSAGATIDVITSQGVGGVHPAFSITTSAGTTNGLLGTGPAFATFEPFNSSVATWATVSGGTIVGLLPGGYGSTYTPGTNVDVTASSTQANITVNSLRFNAQNQTPPVLTLSGTNTLQSGGVLVTVGTTAVITGGTLTAPNSGELLVHAHGDITINSSLVSSVGLTTTVGGAFTLGGANPGLTGPININRGGLTVTATAAVNSASAINFNDNENSGGTYQQALAVNLGAGTNGTISPPILVSAFTGVISNMADNGTAFLVGSSNSRVTLSGVISSAPGQTTPVFFSGDGSSGFNLMNTNTFTGNINLFDCLLGITSDANLGNAANLLTIETHNNSGGLEFLNTGINVVRAVAVDPYGPGRIVSNGSDNNTISSPISGSGGLIKDGTGTLTITNSSNTITGGITVTGGALSLGATGGLPAGTTMTVAAGATFTPGTSPNGNSFGTLTLNGGTFRVSAGTGQTYQVNQIVTNAAGGTIDFTGAGGDQLQLVGTGAAITVNGNSTWLSPANSTTIVNAAGATIPISVVAGATFTNGIALATNSAFGYQVIGGGTLFQNSDATNVVGMAAPVTVTQSTFRVTDASSNGGVGNLGTGQFTLDGSTFSYGGATAVTVKPMNITATGATIAVELATTTLTDNGTITSLGGLTKIGPGTLGLGSSGNAFTSLTITAGTIQTANDNTLGTPSTIPVAAAGTLQYTGTTMSARTFNLNFGTLQVGNSAATLTLNGATVNGGFVAGPGTFAVTGGTALNGATSFGSTIINVTGAGSFTNFTNGGPLTVAAGAASLPTLTRFTNQVSGAMTVGAGSQVNVADFESYGTLMLAPNTTAAPTVLTNVGTSSLAFGGGSQTFIGTPATADPTGQNIVDYVDLHGQNAIVAGGLLVNNGGVFDTVGAGTGTIIAEFGALVKGAGFYQNTVKTQNGGKFQTGNSPGSATFGNFVFGPGGVSNYIFAIDDATGTAGPSPGPSGLVSGWGLIKAVQVALGATATSGNFTWTATPSNPLTVAIDTLVNPTTVGTDVAGPMADFDPTQSYSWTAARWTGTYSGPTDAATLNADTSFDTSGIVNPIAGTFGWSLDAADQTLSLIYTPSSVPEPGTLALAGLAAMGLAWRRRGPSFRDCS